MARPFKDINEKLLVQRYLEGATSRELAKDFKISHLTVLNRVKKYVDIERQFVVKKSIKIL